VIKERLIDPLQPVGRYLDGYRIAEMRESQIRPWPIHGTLNEPCPDWITKDIPDSRKKMAVLLDGKTLEPEQEKVSGIFFSRSLQLAIRYARCVKRSGCDGADITYPAFLISPASNSFMSD
jgi:hypothetical protein